LKTCLPFILLLFVCSSLHLSSVAQQYHFKNYSVEDGVAQSQVYALYEDSRGYIWMGTRGGGLTRFDGHTFKTYSVKDGMASNYIFCISEDEHHRLWIGTNNGLSIYDGLKFENHFPGKDSSLIHVQAIAGNWLATNDGLYRFDGKSFSLFSKCFSHMNVLSVFRDHSGIIWAGSAEHGLARISYDQGKEVSVPIQYNVALYAKGSGLGKNAIQCIAENKEHQLLVGTFGLGVFVQRNTGFVHLNTGNELDKKIILDIRPDRQGNIWFATLTNGVCKWNPNDSTCRFLQEADGLSNNHVRCILQDTRSNFWFGTSGGGVSKYSGQPFNHFNKSNGLSSSFIYSVFRDSEGRLWIGTGDKGVCEYNGRNFISYSQEEGFRNVKVKAIAEDALGKIWFGTDGQGLYIYDDKEFTPIHELHGKYIRSILRDQKQNMWVATAGGGVYKISTDETHRNKYEVLVIKSGTLTSQSRINCLAEDKQGRIWFGAETGGIGFIDDNGTVRTFRQKDGIASDVIRSLAMDTDGYLWIGTAGSGVTRMKTSSPDFPCENFTLQNGLTSLNVYLMALDEHNNLFIGSESGLDKLDLGYDKHLLEIHHFGKSEGFTGIETCQNATFRDTDGTLWFGTVNGLTSFNPHDKQKNTLAPTTRITGLSLFYEPLEKTAYAGHVGRWGEIIQPLVFPHNQNHLSFDFTGINLSAPEEVLYRWKLNGFDKFWSPPSSRKDATYSNLPPGDYTFELKACNEDGVWNEKSQAIAFSILKPYWLMPWFLLTCSALVLVLTTLGFRWRVASISAKATADRQLLETEKSMLELEQKALRLQMNPHFIFNALNSIQAQIMENNEQTARFYLAKFSRLMRMILENSRNASISLEEEISTLDNYLSLEQFSSGNQFDYEITVDESCSVEEDRLPPMMIQPFVENAILHGFKHLKHRGKLSIRFSRQNGFLECSIGDNGVGRKQARDQNRAQQEEHHKSTALIVTQERLDLMDKDHSVKMLEITDLLDAEGNASGTKVCIRIPG
jgi:ligand-binding sensor domain-containing protein